MSTQLIKLDATEFGVEKSRAKEMESAFVPMINRLKEMEAQHNNIVKKSQNGITKEICDEAHQLRLQYVKSRTSVDAVHKIGKQDALLLGRAWDGLKNQYLFVTNRKEAILNTIENHFEILEEERKAKLKDERETALLKYEVETEHIQLGDMTKEVWDNYFSGVKLQYENSIAAEKKAETDRIAKEKADREEQERIRKDNERLQKEVKEREKAIQAERKLAELREKAIEEKARKERLIMEAKVKKEAEKRAEIEAELQAKKDAETKAEAEKQAAIEAELFKGDNEKFTEFISILTELKSKYSFKSKKYQNLQASTNELLDKLINFSKSKM